MSIFNQARHPGPGSGCQGCDPAVAMPAEDAAPFLCALCDHWLELEGAVFPNPLTALEARRRALAA